MYTVCCTYSTLNKPVVLSLKCKLHGVMPGLSVSILVSHQVQALGLYTYTPTAFNNTVK